MIAISYALLRKSIAVQLTIYGMVVAAIGFERRYVLLRDAAAISMYRYSVTTPYSTLHPVFRGTRAGKTIFGIVLIVQRSLLSILSQFIFTILVADMDLGFITGRGEQVSLAYRFSPHVGTLIIRPPSAARSFLGVLPFRLHITDKRTFGTALSALFWNS